MKKLTSRQASILIFLSIVALKVIVLPSIIYFHAGSSGYVTIFFALFVDFATLLLYLHIMKKNPDMRFFDIISHAFGKIFAKIVMFLIFTYFIIKSFLVLKSTFNFFVEVVYDNMNWFFFLATTLLFIYYILHKDLRITGRVGEVLFWIIFIAINIVLIITGLNMDITAVLPIFQNGAFPIFSTGIQSAYAFGDYLIIIFMMGNIKYNEKTSTQMTAYAFMGISTILNFFIVFLCNFGHTAVNKDLAIADLALYIDLAVTVSRLEWIAIFIWTITLLIQLCIYAYCTKASLDYVVPTRFIPHTAKVVVLALLGTYLIEAITSHALIRFLLSYEFGIFAIIIQLGIPILAYIAHIILARRKKTSYAKTLVQIH